MKNEKIVWRLKEQPTVENLRELVKNGILSKDEAREILFSSETEEARDKKSLEGEIKFLRELVEKLAKRSDIITTIREIEVPYRRWDWHRSYSTWCGGTTYTTTENNPSTTLSTISDFSDIKTF